MEWKFLGFRQKECLLRLYTCYIRSLLNYGIVLFSTASPRTLLTLNIIQNTTLRIATGALRSSSVTSLHVESNTLSLRHH